MFRYCSLLRPVVEHLSSLKALLHCDSFQIFPAWLPSAENWKVAVIVVPDRDSNMDEEVLLAKDGIDVDNIQPLLGKETGIEEASAMHKEAVSYFVSRVLAMGDPGNN